MGKTSRQISIFAYCYVATAAVLFAVTGTSSKFLFHSGITPYQLAQLRTTSAFICLLAWLLSRHSGLLKISVRDVPYFIAFGVLGLGAVQFFYLFAISKINVAAAILIHYTGPIFIALYAVWFQHQKLGTVSILAIAGTLAGCFLAVGGYNLELLSLNRIGIISGFFAAVTFAVYTLLSEYGMRKYSHWTVLLYGMLFAAVMWNVLHPAFEAILHTYSPVQWGWIFFIATFGTVIPFGLYFKGINIIRATHASVTATLEPISAGVMATVFLGEVMQPLQVIGGLIVILSIVLLQLKTDT